MTQEEEEDVILYIENIFKKEALENILKYYHRYENVIEPQKDIIVVKLQGEVNGPKLQVYNNIDFNKISHIVVMRNGRKIETHELFTKNADRNFVRRISKIIKTKTKYCSLEITDIFLVMIFMFYALRFNEPTIDIFSFIMLETYLANYVESSNLLFDIVYGTIMVNGKDLSSILRTYIMGMKYYPGYQTEYNCSLCEWFSNLLKFFFD